MISWRNGLLLTLLAGVLIQDIRLYSKIQSQETLSAYLLNVGQGDASFLHYGNRWILVDGGDRGGSQQLVSQSLRNFIRSQGITRIDLAVLSHAHADHLSGLVGLLQEIPVGMVLEPGHAHNTRLYTQFMQTLKLQSVDCKSPPPGTRILIGEDLTMEVLAPDNTRSDLQGLNNNSLVLHVRFGRHQLLFTGDIESDAEAALLGRYGNMLRATILKVPHHGSKTSSTAAFLKAVAPRVAFISCGKDNQFGFPDPEVVHRLVRMAEVVHMTNRHGTLLVRFSDDKMFLTQHYQRRPWHFR